MTDVQTIRAETLDEVIELVEDFSWILPMFESAGKSTWRRTTLLALSVSKSPTPFAG